MTEPTADQIQAVARAISDADADFGFSISLTRLVDGVSTYTLTMPGYRQEFPGYDDASEAMHHERDKRRAVKVIAALSPNPPPPLLMQ